MNMEKASRLARIQVIYECIKHVTEVMRYRRIATFFGNSGYTICLPHSYVFSNFTLNISVSARSLKAQVRVFRLLSSRLRHPNTWNLTEQRPGPPCRSSTESTSTESTSTDHTLHNFLLHEQPLKISFPSCSSSPLSLPRSLVPCFKNGYQIALPANRYPANRYPHITIRDPTSRTSQFPSRQTHISGRQVR